MSVKKVQICQKNQTKKHEFSLLTLICDWFIVLLNYLIHEFPKSFAVLSRWDTRNIFAKKSALKSVLKLFLDLKDCEDIYYAQYIELSRVRSQYSTFIGFKQIVGFVWHLRLFLSFP